MKTLKPICLSVLTIMVYACCSKTNVLPESVQLWDNGPYWSTTNLGAAISEDKGSFVNLDEALAAVQYGWRLPSCDDISGLKEKCSWEWAGKGYEITGENGNSIFLPAGGYLSRKITAFDFDNIGHYWTSEGKEMYFHSVYCGIGGRGSDNGLSVRMVRDNNPVAIAQISGYKQFTGKGNKDESLMKITLISRTRLKLKSIQLNIEAPKNTVSAVRAICNGRTIGFSEYDGSDEIKIEMSAFLPTKAEIEILADVCEDAAEGSVIKASVSAMESSEGGIPFCQDRPAEREVLLARKCLYKPGDYGSGFWRIPAIRQLSDGTLLTVNDRRNDTENDLPGRIDVVSRYSMDNGQTWSEPVFVARNYGHMHGYGDPSLVECEDGTVICFFCGGETFMRSFKENPQRSFFSVSKDFGRTWSEPEEITSQIWGENALNPYCKRYTSNFFSSGNDLLLTHGPNKGRVLVAAVPTNHGLPDMCNHAVYSDDCGKTWQVSDIAFSMGGDEAKMAQLSDGSILMSIRQNGARAYAISHDGGQTWGEQGSWPEMTVTACNGDLLRLDSGVLLQSVPDSMKRHNVTIYASFDEGKTWPYKKRVCHGPSQYSSFTVLKDGTVGIYTEEGSTGLELWFESFSLDWLFRERN